MRILYFIESVAEFTVKTEEPIKLLDTLRLKIPVRSITSVEDNVVKFTCFYRDLKTAETVISENNAKKINVKFYGLKYLLYKYRKRMGLFSACLSLFLFVMFSGMFVWEIRVEGNETVEDGRIVKVLNEVGFKEGILKKSVNLDSVVNEFLIREKRISWIAVNYDGTVAHVEVREAKLPEIYEKKQNVNLIASNDGIVMRSDVIEGGVL